MTNVKNVLARNTISGVVAPVPESYLTHPVFRQMLVVVDDGAKSYVPELYKAKTAEEFTETKASRKKAAPVEEPSNEPGAVE